MLGDEGTGQRCADHCCQWLRQIEERKNFAPMARRNPHAQEQNRSREKSRLGYSEKKSKNVKTSCRRDPGKKQRNNSPCDHNPGKPDAYAKFVQRQITWHLKDYVANKKNAGRKSKLRGRQPKFWFIPFGPAKEIAVR